MCSARASAAASESDVATCIRETKAKYGYVLDPHTACGVVAADRVGASGDMVVLATAHPAKFPDAIEAITGARPGLPARLADLMTDAERFDVVANDLATVEQFVERVAQASIKAAG